VLLLYKIPWCKKVKFVLYPHTTSNSPVIKSIPKSPPFMTEATGRVQGIMDRNCGLHAKMDFSTMGVNRGDEPHPCHLLHAILPSRQKKKRNFPSAKALFTLSRLILKKRRREHSQPIYSPTSAPAPEWVII